MCTQFAHYKHALGCKPLGNQITIDSSSESNSKKGNACLKIETIIAGAVQDQST
jgi:hypothetical protein